MRKKYTMTLLEVMIVIAIIAIIGSVMGYNMRGSLDNGKAFKTQEGGRKLYEIVQLEMTQDTKEKTTLHRDEIATILKNSHLVKNVKNLMKDGWGEEYQFTIEQGEFRFRSEKYQAYCDKKGIKTDYPWENEDDLSH